MLASLLVMAFIILLMCWCYVKRQIFSFWLAEQGLERLRNTQRLAAFMRFQERQGQEEDQHENDDQDHRDKELKTKKEDQEKPTVSPTQRIYPSLSTESEGVDPSLNPGGDGVNPSLGPQPDPCQGQQDPQRLQYPEGVHPSLSPQASGGVHPSLSPQAPEGVHPSLGPHGPPAYNEFIPEPSGFGFSGPIATSTPAHHHHHSAQPTFEPTLTPRFIIPSNIQIEVNDEIATDNPGPQERQGDHPEVRQPGQHDGSGNSNVSTIIEMPEEDDQQQQPDQAEQDDQEQAPELRRSARIQNVSLTQFAKIYVFNLL